MANSVMLSATQLNIIWKPSLMSPAHAHAHTPPSRVSRVLPSITHAAREAQAEGYAPSELTDMPYSSSAIMQTNDTAMYRSILRESRSCLRTSHTHSHPSTTGEAQKWEPRRLASLLYVTRGCSAGVPCCVQDGLVCAHASLPKPLLEQVLLRKHHCSSASAVDTAPPRGLS